MTPPQLSGKIFFFVEFFQQGPSALPHALLPKLHRNTDPVKNNWDTKGKMSGANLDCAYMKCTLFDTNP